MTRLLKYIFIFTAMALCVGYAVIANAKGTEAVDRKVCSNVNVTITDYDQKKLISNEEISLLLKSKDLNPIGKSLRHIRTKTIEDVIEKHPMVRHAECYKTPKGEIQINIEQRNPVLRVVGVENYYVDDLRKTMPVSLNFAAYVPIATGRVTKKTACGPLFDFAQHISRDPFWNDQIAQININDRMQVELVPRVGEHIIILGTFDRYKQKLEKLRKLYLFGLNETGWNAYSSINLQYKDQVVCTRK
ncbi:MAG: cell division protein FtsQ [Paludibacteraceae bacterium]|nr:cell division protein FtsQ [Paludibacteraceae bacterium]